MRYLLSSSAAIMTSAACTTVKVPMQSPDVIPTVELSSPTAGPHKNEIVNNSVGKNEAEKIGAVDALVRDFRAQLERFNEVGCNGGVKVYDICTKKLDDQHQLKRESWLKLDDYSRACSRQIRATKDGFTACGDTFDWVTISESCHDILKSPLTRGKKMREWLHLDKGYHDELVACMEEGK